jgi:hypothetical protein
MRAWRTRKQREKQEDIWIADTELASAPGHPFYERGFFGTEHPCHFL